MSLKSEPATRIEGVAKVTGAGRYAAEAPTEGMLYARLVQAPIAKGRIQAIDADAAQAVRGFAALVSSRDFEDLRPSGSILIMREQRIHFAGQPVALVAAESPLSAKAAAAALHIAYAEETAVTSVDHALAAPYAPDMCGARAKAASLRGDPEAGLAQADVVIRETYATPVNNHHPLEPHAVVCWWEGDHVTVHTSTQAIFGTRAIIAHTFGLPPENVRVITKFLGGGFGCKGQLFWPYMMMALIASRRTGQPVRLELTRAQMFNLVGRRQETVQRLALGATWDGRLTAIDHRVSSQTSSDGEYADPVATISRQLYACANVATSHRLTATNEPRPIPMRGPGEAPGSFALESAIDELAHALDIDPVDLRLRNYADHDQDARKPWSSNSLRECWRQGAERFGWERRPREGWSEGHLRIGWGVGATLYPARRQACRSRVRLAADGSLLVQCGTQDMGSGTYTLLAQLAAQVLGLPTTQVSVELGDTLLPEGPFSAGSQVTQSVAPSVTAAAHAVRDQLASLATNDPASPLFGVSPDDLTFADGLARAPGNASESLEAILTRSAPDGLEGDGDAPVNPPTDVTSLGFGAIFVDVAVDPDLGEVRVRRVCGAFAAGRIVNPLLARSQYVGGLIGGIGMALHERTITDRVSGRILGDTLADYLIPTHADMPEFDIVMIDEDDPHLPGGVKGVGMLGSVGISAAIANAVFHATGRRVRSLPIRIEDFTGSSA